MRILLASEYFYPETKGGTEMYVYQLAKELLDHGHECAVLSLSNSKLGDNYEGIKIFYIPFVEDIAQESNKPTNFNHLLECIQLYKPDVFHLHTVTPSLGINHLEKLYELKIRVVFTSHITSFSCLRGDLMLYGEEVCDGKLDRNRCMKCWLQHRGVNSKIQRDMLTSASNFSFIKFAFPTLKIFDNKNEAIEKFKKYVNHFVVVSNWQKKILKSNGFLDSKMSVCRQAIDSENIINSKQFNNSKMLSIGFVGRAVKIKGLDFILDLFLKIDSKNAILNIGAIKSYSELDYYNKVSEKAKQNNIFWNENLDSSKVLELLDSIDLLVVPSFWLETGPYVIFEAMARRVPVLTFNKGGAVELIKNNENGWLVNTAEEFEDKLKELIANKELVIEASSKITDVRSTTELYSEMLSVYEGVQI